MDDTGSKWWTGGPLSSLSVKNYDLHWHSDMDLLVPGQELESRQAGSYCNGFAEHDQEN